MKKPFKKLVLDKKTILTLNESNKIKGGRLGQEQSGAETCGGFTTQPDCPPSIGCAN